MGSLDSCVQVRLRTVIRGRYVLKQERQKNDKRFKQGVILSLEGKRGQESKVKMRS